VEATPDDGFAAGETWLVTVGVTEVVAENVAVTDGVVVAAGVAEHPVIITAVNSHIIAIPGFIFILSLLRISIAVLLFYRSFGG
jgi:hypothetical protein